MTPLQWPLELGFEPFDPDGGNDGISNDGSVYAVVAVSWGGIGLMTLNRHGLGQHAMTHDTASKGGGASDAAGLVQQPVVEPDAPFPALVEGGGGEATLGLPCKVLPDGMMAIP